MSHSPLYVLKRPDASHLNLLPSEELCSRCPADSIVFRSTNIRLQIGAVHITVFSLVSSRRLFMNSSAGIRDEVRFTRFKSSWHLDKSVLSVIN